MLGKQLGGVEGRSLQLIGLGMYEKFTKAINLLNGWIAETESTSSIIFEDVVSIEAREYENIYLKWNLHLFLFLS